MATQSDLLPSWRFSQNVAANGGQPARLERSGRVSEQGENPPRQEEGIQGKCNWMTLAKKNPVELTTSACSIKWHTTWPFKRRRKRPLHARRSVSICWPT